MKLPKCCESTIGRDGADMPGAECERKKGHKKRHRERWHGALVTESGKARPYTVTVTWK